MSRSRPDAGLWYYHAPEGPKAGMPKVQYPPLSQVPILNGVPIDPHQEAEDEKNKNARFWFKETDTPYIKLSKLGGRKDLLAIPDPKPASQQVASEYASSRRTGNSHRCDWFYQLDNLAEDAARAASEPQQVHKFQVPEYMTHHERNPKAPAGYHSNAPFATDGKNFTDPLEGGNPTDKTKKIQEPLKEGCGRRMAKQKEMDRRTQQGYYPAEYTPQEPSYNRPMHSAPNQMQNSPPMEGEQISMTKLLSYGYQRDWVDEQNKWWNENEKRAGRFAESNEASGFHPNPAAMGSYHDPAMAGTVTGSEYNQQYAQYVQPQQRNLEAQANADRMRGRAPYGN